VDGPRRVEGREDTDQASTEKLGHERVCEHLFVAEDPALLELAHPKDTTCFVYSSLG
jgi:hypothetical protein